MITNIELRDYRAIQKIDLPLGQVNLIAARNAAGKSSIRGAVALALTGKNEWLGDRASTVQDQIRHGAKKATITLGIDGIGDVVATIGPKGTDLQVSTWAGTTTEQRKRLLDELGATPELMSAILSTTRAIEMDPRDLGKLVAALQGRGAEVTPAMVREALVQRGIEPDLADWTIENYGSDLAGDPTDVTAKLFKRLYEGRKEIKRQHAGAESRCGTLGSMLPPDGGDSRSVLETRLKRLRIHRDNPVRNLAILASVESIESLKGEREAAERYFAALDDRLSKARLEVDAVDPEVINGTMAAARAWHGELRDKVSAMRAEIARLEADAAVEVPVCGSCGTECPTCRKSVKKREAKLVEDKKVIELSKGDIERWQTEITEIERAVGQQQKSLETRSTSERLIPALLKERANAAPSLERLDGRIREIEDLVGFDVARETLEAELAQHDADIAEAESALKLHEGADEVRAKLGEAERSRDELAGQVEEFERLVNIADAGLTTILTGDRKPDVSFNQEFDTILAGITDGEYRGEATVEDGAVVVTVSRQLIDTRDGHMVPIFAKMTPKCLSASERFRVGIALQCALLKLAPERIRIAMIDGADILDEVNRDALLRFLMQHRDEFRQVVVTATVQRDDLTAPAHDWLRVIWLGRPERPVLEPGETIDTLDEPQRVAA